MSNVSSRTLPAAALGLLSLALVGCVHVQTKPITKEELVATSQADFKIGYNTPPIVMPLTLDEAVARALKYNLDERVSLAEEALAKAQYGVGLKDMLPTIMAGSALQSRSTDLTRRSIDAVTGGLSQADPFISEERTHYTSELTVSWNLLDFGLGYYSAKQSANRVLIADERRRKALHSLVQDVQGAYWRAYSAQRLRQDIIDTIKLAEGALADAKKAEQERLRSPLDSLRFERQILENLRTLESLDQQLSTAKLELAHLINVPPTADFALADPEPAFADDALTVPADRLENLAILGSADLREQHYNVRNARLEVQKTFARMFPRLSFDYGPHYDSDKFLINHAWSDAGAELAMNLMNLATIPLDKKMSDAGVAVADERRVATLMTVISQVHIARQQYANARTLYDRADQLVDIEQRIMDQVNNREQAAVQSKLETVSSKTSLIISILRKYQALADVYAAQGKLQAAMGLDPGVQQIDSMSLPDLTKAVDRAFQDWRKSLKTTEAEMDTRLAAAETAPLK